MRALIAILSFLPAAAAQGQLSFSLADGSQLRGELIGISGDDGEEELLLAGETEELRIKKSELLAIHGYPPHAEGQVQVHLVGGSQVLGRLTGGDLDGETFAIDSVSLGTLSIPIDRLQVLLFRERIATRGAEDFLVPDSVDADEGLFFPASVRGFDRRFGAIDRFTPLSILFDEGGDEPQAFAYRDLSAISLRGGMGPEAEPQSWLLTRSGDLLGAELESVQEGRLQLSLEGGASVSLSPSQISAMSFSSPSWRFLSDLPVLEASERSYFDEGGDALRPHSMDRNVLGDFLAAEGLSYHKGIGVHSRSILRWKVPEGAAYFHARVTLDESVLDLPVRGSVALRVLLDDEVLVSEPELRSGRPAVDLGLLPMRAGAILSLEVDFGDGYDLGDRIDWLNPVFLMER
ncbi:MAG: NPCBM/NEW2 domain-containing protein [Planctomycetota bacterium]|jgi:hypothetical protein